MCVTETECSGQMRWLVGSGDELLHGWYRILQPGSQLLWLRTLEVGIWRRLQPGPVGRVWEVGLGCFGRFLCAARRWFARR